MKKVIEIIIILLTGWSSHAQNINWQAQDEQQPNAVYLNIGYDFGATAQLGYSRAIATFRPILFTLDYSAPMGENWTDDFKVRYGGQIELLQVNNFGISANIISNFRRHETELVRIVSFGTELSALLGYYRPGWHLAGEFGFDKAISTHLKHSDVMKDDYADIKDGWYLPTGGHYFYGLQMGKSIGKSFEASLRLGATDAQGNDENDIIPYYLQLGFNKRF